MRIGVRLSGAAAGFQIHLSNNVPNTSGTKYKIIAGTNLAGSMAEQLVELEAYRREKNFSDAVKGLHVFGAKVLEGKALASFPHGRLQLENAESAQLGQKANYVLWCKKAFPADMLLEIDFRPLREPIRYQA